MHFSHLVLRAPSELHVAKTVALVLETKQKGLLGQDAGSMWKKCKDLLILALQLAMLHRKIKVGLSRGRP